MRNITIILFFLLGCVSSEKLKLEKEIINTYYVVDDKIIYCRMNSKEFLVGEITKKDYSQIGFRLYKSYEITLCDSSFLANENKLVNFFFLIDKDVSEVHLKYHK